MAVERRDNNDRMQYMVPKIGGPIIQQPTVNGESEDKYSKFKNFIQMVNNVFESYNTMQTERIAITENWIDRKGLKFLDIDAGRTRKMQHGRGPI